MALPLGRAPFMGHDCIRYLKTEIERLKRQRNDALRCAGLDPECKTCVAGVCSAHQPAIGRAETAEAVACRLHSALKRLLERVRWDRGSHDERVAILKKHREVDPKWLPDFPDQPIEEAEEALANFGRCSHLKDREVLLTSLRNILEDDCLTYRSGARELLNRYEGEGTL